ncbi:MAG: substrate-binding domain-containing protein [Caulobacter sp.]|nr:substrate-binding domain-containing protein [Caulobacter sp.]
MAVSRKQFLQLLAGFGLATVAGCAKSDERVKVGFIVKQPEEPWFQNEWKFAQQAADKYGFELIKIGATDGDKVLAAIDNLATRGAGGFVICAPNPRLGTAIQQRAKANDLKVMSVDDRLIGSNDQPIEAIPHVGISATKIGALAGETIAAEAKRRGWNLAEVGLLRISFDSLQTARDRTMGAQEALIKAGLRPENVYDATQRTSDTEGGFNAASPVLTRQANVRHWAIVGMNDETVLGGVRAAEGLGMKADAVIACGIGGSGTAEAEFAKTDATGFVATILLSPRQHGYDTAEAMYRWIKEGVAPAPLTYTSGQVMNRDNWQALKAREDA